MELESADMTSTCAARARISDDTGSNRAEGDAEKHVIHVGSTNKSAGTDGSAGFEALGDANTGADRFSADTEVLDDANACTDRPGADTVGDANAADK